MKSEMMITILGTGTSTGIPVIGCDCPVCSSSDPKDKRLRSSVLLTIEQQNILIDCGPDFREQMLTHRVYSLDAILLTHEHYDHTGGLDDIRPFSYQKNIPIYAEEGVIGITRQRLPYCFAEEKYPGVPEMTMIPFRIDTPFYIGSLLVQPIRIAHHLLPIAGFRIGNMAYITDMSFIEPDEKEKLFNLDLLIVNALRHEPHPAHQNLTQALALIKELSPHRAVLTHFAHQIGLHKDLNRLLPVGVEAGYDGLSIEI